MQGSWKSEGERGQVLVVFVLALVAIIGMTGLVLDGGSAFAQRRAQQNVADLSAVAAVTAFANAPGAYGAKDAAARSRALAVASENGYPNGEAETTITIAAQPDLGNGSQRYNVTVHRPHRNNFSGLLGQPVWDVSATATAVTGIPNAAIGAMPLIFNQQAFDANYEPKARAPGEEFSEPGNGPGDVPLDATSFNWTVYCTAQGAECNADSDTVRELIDQMGHEATVDLEDRIAPLNAGAHTTLFQGMEQWVGYEFPVAIICTRDTDPNCQEDGDLVGWAIFHLTAIQGGSRKVIIGYFVNPINHAGLKIEQGRGGTGFGGYVIKLVN